MGKTMPVRPPPTIQLRATCLNPTDREDFCAVCGKFEVGRLYRDEHDTKQRWRWMFYRFFQPGRVGPFEGYKHTSEECRCAIEDALLSGSGPEIQLELGHPV